MTPLTLPELGPGLAGVTADKNLGVILALFVLNPIKIGVMTGQTTRGKRPLDGVERSHSSKKGSSLHDREIGVPDRNELTSAQVTTLSIVST